MMKRLVPIAIVILLMSILTSCKDGSEQLSLNEIVKIGESDITQIEFRDGRTGALYRTTDHTKITGILEFLNKYKYQQAKQPEPFTGYLYGGNLKSSEKEIKIGFAKDMMTVENEYYHVTTDKLKEFFSELIVLVEAFGRVPTTDGNTP
jgi:hypothetical protein